jgi:hypothetical protein
VGRFQGKGGSRSTACSVSTGSDREICNAQEDTRDQTLDRSFSMSEICDDEHLSVWLATNRVAEDGLGVVRRGPERRLPALGRRPGGGAPTGAIRGGGGGAGAAGEAHRHRRGRREGVRPLTSGGHMGPVWHS